MPWPSSPSSLRCRHAAGSKPDHPKDIFPVCCSSPLLFFLTPMHASPQQARMLSVWRIANVTGLHQINPTSFFVVYIQLYANNCKICNSVLHLLLYIYYIPSMSLLFKVNCMHFFAESSEAPCLNKVAAPLTDLTEREHWFLLKFYCTLMAGWSM